MSVTAGQVQWSQRSVITEIDATTITQYYNRVRIPLLHGLTRRLLRGERGATPEIIGADVTSSDVVESLWLGLGYVLIN